jgi:hypothetical protein
LDTKISEESVFKQVYSSTCSAKDLSISMTKSVHAVKGGLLSYCDTQALVSFEKYMPPPLPYFMVNICPFPLPHFVSIFFLYL